MLQSVCLFMDTKGFGGAEQAMLTLLAGLDRSRWEPTLIYHPSPGIAPLVDGARELGVTLWPVPRMGGRRSLLRLLGFARALRARRPAVFHAYLTWPLGCKNGLLAAILARVPAIVVSQHLFMDFDRGAATYLQQRLIAAGSGRYLTVSNDLARRLQQRLHIPAQKFQVVHNGIVPETYERPANPALRASLTRGSQRPVVLTTARLVRQKGLTYLLDAAVNVPDAQFVVAGDGAEREALVGQAAALGLGERFTFLGFRQDIPELLACCDLFVLPSLYEGFPISILEAFAAGVAVVTSNIGGTDELVVSGETGLLVPPAHPAALALAIRTLLADAPLRQRLAAAGRAKVRQDFSASRLAREVMQVYEDLLAHRQAG